MIHLAFVPNRVKGTEDMKKIILALTIIIAAVSLAAADTIYLRDGRTMRGTLLGFVNGRFVVRVEHAIQPANPRFKYYPRPHQ